jgi:hypothetical protein
MTRAEAKERAMEVWGDMGIVGRTTASLILVGLVWAGLTGFYRAAAVLFVPRSEMEVRDDSLRAYLYRRDSAQAIWLVEDRAWKAEMKRDAYRECVRHHGERRCLPKD